MAIFFQSYGSQQVPCPPPGWDEKFMKTLNSQYPGILKKAKILHNHQLDSGQGTAHFHTSFQQWFMEFLFQNLRSKLLEENMELQSLPVPCSPSCPCCTGHIQMIRTRLAKSVHEQLSQLLNDQISCSDPLWKSVKKAFKDAWRRYFGELKLSKADNLEGFSLAEALSTVLEHAKVNTESQGGSALRTSALSQGDDADAVMYD